MHVLGHEGAAHEAVGGAADLVEVQREVVPELLLLLLEDPGAVPVVDETVPEDLEKHRERINGAKQLFDTI